MGLRDRLVARFWYKPPGDYQVVGATVPPARSRKLRALIWRDEGVQDEQTGAMVGQRDRALRIAMLGIARHWSAHWKFWISAAIAGIAAAAAIGTLWIQLDAAIGDRQGQRSHVHCHCDCEGGHQPDTPVVACPFPLRCD